MHKVTSS